MMLSLTPLLAYLPDVLNSRGLAYHLQYDQLLLQNSAVRGPSQPLALSRSDYGPIHLYFQRTHILFPEHVIKHKWA